MFGIFKRLRKLEQNQNQLLSETESMIIIMHNLIEDLHHSGQSHVKDITFANVLYKALEGHYKAVKTLIDYDEYIKKPIECYTKVDQAYKKRFRIFPVSKRKR